MVRRKLLELSRAETEILRIVWELEEATVRQVVKALPSRRKVAYATVQTLLRRLEAKGYLKHRCKGKAHVFYPAVKKHAVIKKTVANFVDRLFGGDPIPLIQHLACYSRITAEDIETLKKLLDKKTTDI